MGTPEQKGSTVGILRKTMSIGTVGMVSFRNKDERAMSYARQTRNAARAQVAQNAMMLEHQRQMITQYDHANVREEVRDMNAHGGYYYQPQPYAQPVLPPQPVMPPAGFYVDQSGDSTILRWWDGAQWTDMTRPRDSF